MGDQVQAAELPRASQAVSPEHGLVDADLPVEVVAQGLPRGDLRVRHLRWLIQASIREGAGVSCRLRPCLRAERRLPRGYLLIYERPPIGTLIRALIVSRRRFHSSTAQSCVPPLNGAERQLHNPLDANVVANVTPALPVVELTSSGAIWIAGRLGSAAGGRVAWGLQTLVVS
jgi:hypothetical protein